MSNKALILSLLEEGIGTVQQLRDRSGLDARAISHILQHMKKAGVARVDDRHWSLVGGKHGDF